MKSRLAIVLLAVMSVHACAKKSQDAPSASLERPSQAAQKPQVSRADAAGPPVQGKPEALPPLAPFADGKRVRIKPLEDGIKALEITVPASFKLKYEGGEELAPSARLIGQDLEIVVGEPPDGEFSPLAEEMRMHMNNPRPPAFLRAEETEDGFLLVHRDWLVGDHPLYNATVLRPKLKVECRATGLEKQSDADLVASICLTLRAAPPKTRN